MITCRACELHPNPTPVVVHEINDETPGDACVNGSPAGAGQAKLALSNHVAVDVRERKRVPGARRRVLELIHTTHKCRKMLPHIEGQAQLRTGLAE